MYFFAILNVLVRLEIIRGMSCDDAIYNAMSILNAAFENMPH